MAAFSLQTASHETGPMGLEVGHQVYNVACCQDVSSPWNLCVCSFMSTKHNGGATTRHCSSSTMKLQIVHVKVNIWHDWYSVKYEYGRFPWWSSCFILYSVKWCWPREQKSSCVANILDISTKSVPLYSPSCTPSGMSNFIFLAPLLANLAYLAMLFIFIFQVTHTASSVCVAWKINNTAK